ncbi:MAG: RICIN domain-containing protein [Clostridia bacterium]|nr:RICIN domain-containing protein [Clostridia bacterium]
MKKKIFSIMIALTFLIVQMPLAVGPWGVQRAYAAGITTLVSKHTYKIINKRSGKALDVLNASCDAGANIIQWGYGGGDSQKWILEDVGGGYFKIINKGSGKALDVSGGSYDNGGDVIQWGYWGGDNQQWSVQADNGYYKIINRRSGKALDVSGGSYDNGGDVIQWDYWGGDNQQWILEDITLDEAATQLYPVKLRTDSYNGKYIFCSSDKEGDDYVIEAHTDSTDERNDFFIEKKGSKYRLVTRQGYIFRSSDEEGGDYIMEAHWNKYSDTRTEFTIEQLSNGKYRICYDEGYLFVSSTLSGNDNYVEADWNKTTDPRAEFSLEVIDPYFNYASWMEKTKNDIGNKKLWEITMPGAHDSGTWDLKPAKYVGNTGDSATANLDPDAAIRMAKTQDWNIKYQLASGARYFDMRVSYGYYHVLGSPTGSFHRIDDGKYYTQHTVIGSDYEEVLSLVKEYLDSSPKKELIILNFSHFENFGAAQHSRFQQLISTKLGNYIYKGNNILGTTYNDYVSSGSKVIIRYDDEDHEDTSNGFYSPDEIPLFDDYANKNNHTDVMNDQLSKLQTNYGDPYHMFLLSWTLTPTITQYIEAGTIYPNRTIKKLYHEDDWYPTTNNLESFVSNYGNFKMNILYTDFCNTGLTDISMKANRLEGTNYALTATVTADSEFSSNTGASNAVDGHWAQEAGDCWISTGSTSSHWLKLDFGQAVTIDLFKIRHAGAATRDFKILGSDDGTTFTSIKIIAGNIRSETHHPIAFPKPYRYVMLYITNPNGGYDNYARIFEFEAWNTLSTNTTPDPGPQTVNPIYDEAAVTAAADSEYSSNFVASNAVDGQWAQETGDCWISGASSSTHWLQLEFDGCMYFNRYRVRHSGNANLVTRDFKIQGSNDAFNWTDLKTITGNTSSVTEHEVYYPNSYRYVRLYITKPNADIDNHARIYEFEAYYVDDGEGF